jgi:hypothetical protein
MKKIFVFTLLAQVFMMIVVGCAPGAPAKSVIPVTGSTNSTPAPGEIHIPSTNIQVNAPGPNPLENKPDTNGQTAGALIGIWHGFISPVTLILSFMNKDVQMYEVHNNGNAYNFGFFLGIVILMAITSAVLGSRRFSRRRV